MHNSNYANWFMKLWLDLQYETNLNWKHYSPCNTERGHSYVSTKLACWQFFFTKLLILDSLHWALQHFTPCLFVVPTFLSPVEKKVKSVQMLELQQSWPSFSKLLENLRIKTNFSLFFVFAIDLKNELRKA